MTTLLKFFNIDIEILGKIGVYSIHHKYDPKKLYVSVFEGNSDVPKDTESFEIWKKTALIVKALCAQGVYSFGQFTGRVVSTCTAIG